MTDHQPVDDPMAIVVDHPDGTQTRWADDEPDAGNVPADLTYSSTMPGGHKGASSSLLRNLRNVGREGLFDRLRVLGPGGQVRWDGRLQQMPVSTDSGGRVTPQAVGHSALLEDRADAREIYIDREMARWGQTSLQRQIEVAATFKPLAGATSSWQGDSSSAGPALHLEVPGYTWETAAGRPMCELVYNAAGIPIAALYGGYYSNVPDWTCLLYAFDTPDAPAYTSLASLGTSSGPATPTPIAVSVGGRPSILFQLYYGGAPAGTADTTWYSGLRNPVVIGAHGLPTPDGGVLASDVIANALARWAPDVKYSTGPNGTIQPTTSPIRHLVFPDFTTPAQIIDRANSFHAWDWAIWDDATFHFHERGTRGRTWQIATADGLDLSLEGETTDRVQTGVVVQYTGFDGVQHSVGPPGSGADTTSPQLVTTDPDNAAVVHGLTRIGVLQLSEPSDATAAVTKGAIWLRLQATATRRGQAVVTGWVTDSAGAYRPVSEIHAGDELVVTDRPEDPARRIIEASYNRGSRAATLTLDSTAATWESILSWLAADLVGVL